jgi:hypothetical protein
MRTVREWFEWFVLECLEFVTGGLPRNTFKIKIDANSL